MNDIYRALQMEKARIEKIQDLVQENNSRMPWGLHELDAILDNARVIAHVNLGYSEKDGLYELYTVKDGRKVSPVYKDMTMHEIIMAVSCIINAHMYVPCIINAPHKGGSNEEVD